MVQVFNKLLKACCAEAATLPFMKDDAEDKVDKVDETKPNKPVTNNKISFGKKKEEATETKEEEQPVVESSEKPTFSGKATKYEELKWDKLPSEAKSAAEVIGFNQESWEAYSGPESYHKWFEDLSTEQQEAATTLGWDVKSWNYKYKGTKWDELPTDVQGAASALEFTAETWNDEAWPESLNKWWEELTPEQQQYLHVLGYTQCTWE